jgi:hypothetical protein
MSKRLSGLALVSLGALALGLGSSRAYFSVAATEEPPPTGKAARETVNKDEAKATAWTTAVDPKPLSPAVKKGLDWLVEHQHPNGGWSQGEESPNMRGGPSFSDKPDVADTCIAALALVRSGNTPRQGPYRDAVAKAVKFVRAQVEASDAKSLSVSDVQGTRVQQKLGPNIDTFLASILLAEVKGKMADEPGNAAVDLALNKVLDKIKKNQKADGTWDNNTGWAPILAQSMGGKGLNRAAQAGAVVSPEVLARAESFAVAQASAAASPSTTTASPVVVGTSAAPVTAAYRPPTDRAGEPAGLLTKVDGFRAGGMGSAGGGMGSAGVELYGRSANLAVLQDSVNSFHNMESDLRDKAENSKDDKERSQARESLSRFAKTREVNREARQALLGRLDDAQFVSGFGSNGGEEFLSYMNISESLVVKGGSDWKRWDDAMAGNLGSVQNDDGSWSGHHCITGRTFCTSSALLVLMADRTPVPVPVKSDGKAAAPTATRQ